MNADIDEGMAGDVPARAGGAASALQFDGGDLDSIRNTFAESMETT